MPYKLLSATARAVWKEYAPESIKQIGSCFFFEFKDETTKLKILEGGPYFFSKRYLVLTEWKRMLVPATAHPSSIPAWVKLHKLPLECWTASGFSRIASTIGRPIHVDQATATKKRLDYARVCIEISAGDELPDEVIVKINGDAVAVRVEYQWIPPKCTACKVFGHKCNPKPSPTPANPVESVINKGEQVIEAEISNMDPVVQCRVLEALNKGGSAALEVSTKVIQNPTAVCSPVLASTETTLQGVSIDPDPAPPHLPISPPASTLPGSSTVGAVDALALEGVFLVVSHKKKNKRKGTQGALSHTKGR